MRTNMFSEEALATVLDRKDSRPTVIILCGLDGSKRVHWRYDYSKHNPHQKPLLYVTEDFHREALAKKYGVPLLQTYEDDLDREVRDNVKAEIRDLVRRGVSFVIEAPNITTQARKEFLNLITPNYRKRAVACLGYDNRIFEFSKQREDNVRKRFKDDIAPVYVEKIIADQTTFLKHLPSSNEGFDSVRIIGPDGEVIGPMGIRAFQNSRVNFQLAQQPVQAAL